MVTLLFWGHYSRFEAAGSTLLTSPSITDATRMRGDCTETNGRFVLSVPSPGRTASLNFRLKNAATYDLIRVGAWIRVTDVVRGAREWRCARLLLTQYDQNDKWISAEHGVVTLYGTGEWAWHEDVFEIVPEAVHVDLVIQQIGESGTAEFDGILVEPVRFRRSFIPWQAVFSVLWAGMAALYYKRCRLNSRRLRILILLNALAILTGTIIPGEWISDSCEQLKTAFRNKIEQQHQASAVSLQEDHRIEQFNEMVSEVHVAGHYLLFTLLCFLVYWSAALERQHPVYFVKVLFDILIFAAITESLQYLTLDRTADVIDWRVDLWGLLTGLALFLITRGITAGCRRLPVRKM
jgi:VanZ family protein